MRRIKSYTIGFLTSFSFILLSGWTGYDMGDIICKTITLVDADGNIYAKLDEKHINDILNNKEYINVSEYTNKVDSINNQLERIDLNIMTLKQVLTERLQDLVDNIEDIDDEQSSLKRTINRDLKIINKRLEFIEEE